VESKAVPVPDRLDALDRERFKEMVDSAAFALYSARLMHELDRYRIECEVRDGTELHRSQGAAAALRVVLGLPGTILKEMAKSLR
jgi:hypothetical protein